MLRPFAAVVMLVLTATALVPRSPSVSRSRHVVRRATDSVAEALRREVNRREISLLPASTPSPLLPPDKVLRTVFEGLRRPDVPETGSGLRLAWEFSEPDADDATRRSSWAFGELRGRCSWAARGLPILDRTEECDALYHDEDACATYCQALGRDELFLDPDDHASELRAFFSTLLHHDSVTIIGSPRWGADDLVEFDVLVKTDAASLTGSITLRGRILLHRAGPLRDIWYVRGCTLLGEDPSR